MKYLTKRIITAAGCLLMLTSLASAHSGKTDANGGHWDNSTGEYHYHHGYPAHQHPNGVCPYDYDDRTGWNSGSSSEQVSPTIAAARQAANASDEEDLAVNDYGPDAEEDFDSKREAYESGFESGVEYSRSEDIEGNAYHEGYDAGYDEGSSFYDDDSYDEGYENGYNRGYRDGYYADRSSPDNDIIDRSEIPSSEPEHEEEVNTNPQKQKHWEQQLLGDYNIETISLYVLGMIAVLALLILLWGVANGK